MNAEDIRNVTFDKVMRGYRPEEVDAYLDQVAAELERLQTEKADAEKKMYILAEKVDQYRNDEETLKTALLNAQRMGESVIHEARQKAETIIYDATSKASQAREEAVEKVAEEEMLLARLKAEVAHFKGEVLNLYKQHIESLSMIPGAEEKKKKAPKYLNHKVYVYQNGIGKKDETSLGEFPSFFLVRAGVADGDAGRRAEGRACGGGAACRSPGRTGTGGFVRGVSGHYF